MLDSQLWAEGLSVEGSWLDAEQLNERLHDAWVDLDRVEQDQGIVIVHGELEKPVDASAASAIGRFGFRLVIRGVEDVETADSESVGIVPIEQVEYEASLHLLRLTGSIPGCIRIRTLQRQWPQRWNLLFHSSLSEWSPTTSTWRSSRVSRQPRGSWNLLRCSITHTNCTTRWRARGPSRIAWRGFSKPLAIR